jgi:hypothetical protein
VLVEWHEHKSESCTRSCQDGIILLQPFHSYIIEYYPVVYNIVEYTWKEWMLVEWYEHKQARAAHVASCHDGIIVFQPLCSYIIKYYRVLYYIVEYTWKEWKLVEWHEHKSESCTRSCHGGIVLFQPLYSYII